MAGFVFSAAAPPAGVAGVFVIALGVEGRLHPALVGSAEDLSAAIIAARADLPPLPGPSQTLWLTRASPRQRAHIARDLIRKLNPPLNIEERTARAPEAIAMLAPDRAADRFPAAPGEAPLDVSEAALLALVHEFYAEARRDPLLASAFAAIADWDAHEQRIADFWSKQLLGTTRYSGFPYTAHIPLRLKPEQFERWVATFARVAGARLPEEAARSAIDKATGMSRCFQAGLFPVGAQGAVEVR